MNRETRTCKNCARSFTIEPEDFAFYEKMGILPPPASTREGSPTRGGPTWCPECRMRRRMLFRNERKLFRTKDGVTGEPILALFPPESGYTIFRDSYWWSDAWDPLDYGTEFDPSRPFLAQLHELNRRVPKYQSASINMVNSDYSANADGLKNCYLLFNSNYTEDSAYGNGVDLSRDCYDDSHAQKSELCYQSFWITKCYDTHFSSQCEECTSVWFSKNCRGCMNCFGCANLRNKSYCFLNEQLTKDEYQRRLEDLRLFTWSGLLSATQKAREVWLRSPVKYLQGIQNTNVTGEFISHSKNVFHGYLIRECQDIRYVQYSQVPSTRDSMDCTITGAQAELLYESFACGWGGSRLKFCWESWKNVKDLEYCIYCNGGSSDLFGCVGVRKRRFCILNKQYSEEEYRVLRKKIIEQMNAMPYVDGRGRAYPYGEFFPPEFSPFAYKDTISPEHFPLSKEEVLAFGARWQDPNPTEYQKTMTADAIPDSIRDVTDEILKEIIQCAECKRAYRLIPMELQFLRRLNIPAPRSCVDCRHASRIKERNRAVFYHRTCMKPGCTNEFETSYAPERPEIVYCESCYNQEVA